MTSYFDAAALIEEISKKYIFDTETGQIEKVTADMSSFRLKILFSGGFSTGKSAAINTLLDRSLLKEALTPETAIASELIFDEDEYVEAVSKNGRVRMSIGEAESIDTALYEYYISDENIRCWSHELKSSQIKNSISETKIIRMYGIVNISD